VAFTGRLARVYEPVLHPLERLWLGRVRALLWDGVPRDGPGLEIGAGTGLNLAHHPAGSRVVVSDVSMAMLLELRRRRGDAVTLVAADAQALPFRDGSFAWEAATLVFCEVPDPVRGLAEVRRTLRPQGTLHLLEHVRPHGLLGAAARLLTAVTGPLLGEHFDRDTAGSAARAGFEIEERREWLRGGLLLLRARQRPTHESAAPRQREAPP
jgi:ubiquinone/menaquinone biosynthesis C-methylase UbiE